MKAIPRGSDTRAAVRSLGAVLRAHTAALMANTAAQAAVCESMAKQYQLLLRIESRVRTQSGITYIPREIIPHNSNDPLQARIDQIEDRLSFQQWER